MTERKDYRAGLKPPKFGLAALFFMIAMLGASFAAIKFFGGHAAIGVVVMLLAVAAHVVGTAIGKKLRDSGNRPLPNADGELPEYAQRELTDDDFAPSTRLSRHDSMGRATFVLIAIGAILSAAVGAILFLFVYWEKAEIWNIGAGALAFAILGGIATFAGVGFLRASIGAVSQASSDIRKRR
jgi:hypothetical protein